MSQFINERVYPGEFLLSEGQGDISRESVVIAKGQVLLPGAPLGKVLLGGAAASSTGVVGTGNGTIASLTASPVAKIGTYTAVCTVAAANAGTFAVSDPDGIAIGNATVGIPFLVNGLGFTIADGSTDFVVGDVFTITVTPAVVAAFAGNTGNGVFGTVAIGVGVKAGVYKVIFIEPATNLGKFIVEDPTGLTIGVGTVATPFIGGGLTFTIADGGTDFASGDGFTITIAGGSGEYRGYNPNAKDGTETASALLYGDVDTTTGSKRKAAIVRHAEYNESKLPWGTLNDNQKAVVKAQLALRGLIARTGIGLPLGDN